MTENSWERYEKMVIEKLDSHTHLMENIRDDIVEIKVEIGVIKTKLAMIGGVSGAMASFAVMAAKYFMGKV
jgi:hypothetical protein